MGGNIVIKLPPGKDPNQVMQQVYELLAKAGYQNITFSVKQKPNYENTNQGLDSGVLLQSMGR